jgi:hypothetical protein
LLECGSVRRAKQVQVLALVPQRADDCLRNVHLPGKSLGILRSFRACRDHRDVACAVRQRAKPNIDAGGCHVMQFDWDQPRGQTLAASSQVLDQRPAGLVVE